MEKEEISDFDLMEFMDNFEKEQENEIPETHPAGSHDEFNGMGDAVISGRPQEQLLGRPGCFRYLYEIAGNRAGWN